MTDTISHGRGGDRRVTDGRNGDGFEAGEIQPSITNIKKIIEG
jgi:hypothetical protein